MTQPIGERSAATGTTYRSSRVMPVAQNSFLTALLRGIADRDRDAFATLYATLAPPLWHEVVDHGFSAADADAVIASTFVEVWQLASFHARDDTQVIDWIRTSVRRRCAERRHRMRQPAPDPRAGGAETAWWQHTSVNHDESAKRSIRQLLDGRAPADREPPGPVPVRAPLDGRLAPADREPPGPVPVRPSLDGRAPAAAGPAPSAADGDPTTAYRSRRVDLGAASAFGHRRPRVAPAEPSAG